MPLQVNEIHRMPVTRCQIYSVSEPIPQNPGFLTEWITLTQIFMIYRFACILKWVNTSIWIFSKWFTSQIHFLTEEFHKNTTKSKWWLGHGWPLALFFFCNYMYSVFKKALEKLFCITITNTSKLCLKYHTELLINTGQTTLQSELPGVCNH